MKEKWTINRLHDETGMDRRTIKKILNETAPVESDDKSDFYHLSDFIIALRKHWLPDETTFDLVEQQARLTAIKADIAEVERAERRGETVSVEAATRYFEGLFNPMRRIIELSGLTADEQDKIFDAIQSIDSKALINAIANEYKEGADEAGPELQGPSGEAGTPPQQPMGD